MERICIWGYCGLALSAIIVSPVVVILALPLAIGVGLDVFDAAGETPIMLLLCAPLAIVLLRHVSVAAAMRRAVGHLLSRLHLGAAADLIHVQ